MAGTIHEFNFEGSIQYIALARAYAYLTIFYLYLPWLWLNVALCLKPNAVAKKTRFKVPTQHIWLYMWMASSLVFVVRMTVASMYVYSGGCALTNSSSVQKTINGHYTLYYWCANWTTYFVYGQVDIVDDKNDSNNNTTTTNSNNNKSDCTLHACIEKNIETDRNVVIRCRLYILHAHLAKRRWHQIVIICAFSTFLIIWPNTHTSSI